MLLWHNSFPNQDSIINLMNEEKPLRYYRTYNMAAVRVALTINLKLKYVELFLDFILVSVIVDWLCLWYPLCVSCWNYSSELAS